MNSQEPPKFNATSLYVTTAQIALRADPKDPTTWEELYRLMPYLRKSLCCVVCLELVIDPLTPLVRLCQHHVCRACKDRRMQFINRSCLTCRGCKEYVENKSMQKLLLCYHKMCATLIHSPLFKSITMQATGRGLRFKEGGSQLILLIKEGASYQEDFTNHIVTL